MSLVSVIIPIYKVESYIIRCISSVLNQSFNDFEIILVDDCSPDFSLQKAIEFIKSCDKKIKVVSLCHDINLGQSAARNTGIKAASSKYILFLDSDDEILPGCIAEMLKKAEDDHLDLVIGENYLISNSSRKYISVGFSDDIISDNNTILENYVEGKWYNPAWNKLIRRDVIINNNLFFKEGYIFEDELWSFMLASKVHSLGVVRKPLYNYYVRPNSTMTINKDVKRWNGLLKIMPYMKDYIFSEGLNNNASVSRFYLLKLVQIINGLGISKALDKDLFSRTKRLGYIDLIDLYNKGYLSLKETIAYFYFNMPSYIDYLYYRLIKLYFNLFKR